MRLNLQNQLSLRALATFAVLWLVAGILLTVVLLRGVIEQARESFETEARIAHRLLSQRAVQHEAMLAMLQLMQPEAVQDVGKRLAAVYPQVLAVYPRAPQVGPETVAAMEARLQRVDWKDGRFWIETSPDQAGVGYGLEISLPLMVPWLEWPFGSRPEYGTAEVVLEISGAGRWVAQPKSLNGALRTFEFRKTLAAASQPFDLVVERAYYWGDLPWVQFFLGWVLWGALAAVAALLWRQAEARRRAEALLRVGQVSRLNALGELAAGLAHELNQPLTAVLAGTQASRRLLADDPPEIASVREAMQQVEGQARRAADVVARLRRTIDRPGVRELEPVELSVVVRQVMQLMAPECRQRGVTVSLPEGAAWALADRVAVEQIVLNLASNALHALSGIVEAKIVWTVQCDDESARLVLSDNGPGLPPEVVERLFEPFVTARQGGLGLGLSLCETLALEMNGILRHEKPVSDSGAVFILELPAVAPVQEGLA